MSVAAAAPPRRPRDLSDREMSNALKWSAIAHFALFTFILIKSLVFPSTPTIYTPTLRVDLVGLPDILKKDLSQLPKNADLADQLKKAEEQAKQVKPEPIVPPKPVEKADKDEMLIKPKKAAEESDAARKKRLNNALARIKSLDKIASLEDKEKSTAPPLKGNMISKGSSLDGEAKEGAGTQYLDNLRARLQENWALPVWLSRQNLSAQVEIFIDSRGRLQSYRFLRLSGNPQFDEAVKRTLTQSQPYPEPPTEMIAAGIVVGFPL